MLSQDQIKAIDISGMQQKVIEFPRQLRRGWQIGEEGAVGVSLNQFKYVVFSGMGGSAIAGDMLISLFGDQLPIPFVVNRSYRLPGFANSDTLFIASSYSGDTEETLSALEEAEKRGCSVLCVTSGGMVEKKARDKGYPLFNLPGGYPPRAALGYGLGTLIQIMTQLGPKGITSDIFSSAVSSIEEKGKIWQDLNSPDNLALQISRALLGKIPLIYTSVDRYGSVGLRWKCQINENSKSHAFFFPFPEMNHNEIMGWQTHPGTASFLSKMVMVLLKDTQDHPRIQRRMEITKTLVQAEKCDSIEANALGEHFLSRFLYLVHLGDFVSFYLAIHYGTDPTEIEKIDHLKKGLAGF